MAPLRHNLRPNRRLQNGDASIRDSDEDEKQLDGLQNGNTLPVHHDHFPQTNGDLLNDNDDEAPEEESGAIAKERFQQLERNKKNTREALVTSGLLKRRKKRSTNATSLAAAAEGLDVASSAQTAHDEKLTPTAINALKVSIADEQKKRHDAETRTKLRSQIRKTSSRKTSKRIGNVNVTLTAKSAAESRNTVHARSARQAASFLATCLSLGPIRVPAKELAQRRKRR